MQRRYAAEKPHDFNDLGLLKNSYLMPPIAIAVAATRKSQNRQPPSRGRILFIYDSNMEHNFLAQRRIARYHALLFTEPDISS